MSGIFKQYDIRGVYGEALTDETAYKIGFFLPQLLDTQKVLVGMDGRLSSPQLFDNLSRGIIDAGSDVYFLGTATTPMIYYFTDRYGFNASVQITASHNPKEYNGFKISKSGARPVGYDTGLARLEHLVEAHEPSPMQSRGKIINFNKHSEYTKYMKNQLPDMSGFKIAMDGSNGAVCSIFKEIFGSGVLYINDIMDGNFPNHNPNPLEQENAQQMMEFVRSRGCDIGVVFDGDGDRAAFVDEKGCYISPDLITAVLAEECVTSNDDIVIYDVRTSKSVEKHIEKLGARPYMWKVGHVFAKDKMRELGAVLGGELAGHYYFKDFMNCDSAVLAAIKVFSSLKRRSSETLSQIIHRISVYSYSGEINFKIKDKHSAMESLLMWADTIGSPVQVYNFDGYRAEYSDWWFNVRISNTEDYLRLVAEAENDALLNKRLHQIKQILNKYTV